MAQPTTADLNAFGFNEALGMTFVEASADIVVATVEIGPQHHQPYGITHGGVWCSVIETCASIGGAIWYGDQGQVVGVSNHTDFLKAVREGLVTATATPIHRGRLQQLWLVEIRTEDDRLVARGEVRLQNLANDSF